MCTQLAHLLHRCWSLLSCFQYIYHWTCSRMSWAGSFSPSKLPLCIRDLDPSYHGSLGPPESTFNIPNSSTRFSHFQPLLQGSWLWKTDRPHNSVCSNRLHPASAAMWPNNYHHHQYTLLECEPMPNMMAVLPNIGGALCSTQQFASRPLLECLQ